MKIAVLSISLIINFILAFLGIKEEDKPMVLFSIILFIIILIAIF